MCVVTVTIKSEGNPIINSLLKSKYLSWKNDIEAKAKKANLSLTDYISIMNDIKPIYVCEDVKPMLTQLRRIGNNINQIAEKINAKAVRAVNFQEMVDELKIMNDRLCEIARKSIWQ